jgi:hypothetical protein
MYEIESNTIFFCGKAFHPFQILPCLNSDLVDTFVSVVCESGQLHKLTTWKTGRAYKNQSYLPCDPVWLE